MNYHKQPQTNRQQHNRIENQQRTIILHKTKTFTPKPLIPKHLADKRNIQTIQKTIHDHIPNNTMLPPNHKNQTNHIQAQPDYQQQNMTTKTQQTDSQTTIQPMKHYKNTARNSPHRQHITAAQRTLPNNNHTKQNKTFGQKHNTPHHTNTSPEQRHPTDQNNYTANRNIPPIKTKTNIKQTHGPTNIAYKHPHKHTSHQTRKQTTKQRHKPPNKQQTTKRITSRQSKKTNTKQT